MALPRGENGGAACGEKSVRVNGGSVRGVRVRGKPRLGWIDGVKLALGNSAMTMKASGKCSKYGMAWRALVYNFCR